MQEQLKEPVDIRYVENNLKRNFESVFKCILTEN